MNSLEFAINMELDGEKYYRQLAELNEDNALQTIFLLLAKDEETHGKILKDALRNTAYELKDNKILFEMNNVFREIGDFKKEVEENPSQAEAYRLALEKEKESIDLYTKLLAEAKDDSNKELFKYLVSQEENHYKIF